MAIEGIQETLERIGAISPDSVEILATRTRDRDIAVMRDRLSGVIFIEGHYVGDDEYMSGEYRGDDSVTLVDLIDRDRRLKDFRPQWVGKSIIDFGCGRGLFLEAARENASRVLGVELQQSYRDTLMESGIPCVAQLEEATGAFESVFMFHVLEHLPMPVEVLAAARQRLVPGGTLVVEVPHARDLLLDYMNVPAFQDFTLWSQHLVLHTRESLRRLLEAAGFSGVTVRGVQRYGLANHLHWLTRGHPSGHSSPLAELESNELRHAYSASLASLDMTDTLVAIAYS